MLKEIRIKKGLTQATCAEDIGVSLRTYKRYEALDDKLPKMKYEYIISRLEKFGFIDETHGILSIDMIKSGCKEVFSNYDIDFCYLFGSYAKGKANEVSDIDLLISTKETGLKFFGLVEKTREILKKKVDILTCAQIENNLSLTLEILKDGIKIYTRF